MLAIEFAAPGRGARLMDELRSVGIIALASGPTGESLSLTPALTIEPALLDEACDRLVTCIAATGTGAAAP
jgi:4-aminobutyrate aminotransferase-like enzyme